MRAQGSSVTGASNLDARPVPHAAPDTGVRPAHRQPKPKATGLDWEALTPRCAGCGERSGQLIDSRCPTCRGVPQARPRNAKASSGSHADGVHTYSQMDPEDVERRYVDDTRLGRELAELEEIDPVVRHAADRLTDAIDRITHPDDHVRPAALAAHPEPPQEGNHGKPTTRSSAPRATSTSSTTGRAPVAGSSTTREKNPPATQETRPVVAGALDDQEQPCSPRATPGSPGTPPTAGSTTPSVLRTTGSSSGTSKPPAEGRRRPGPPRMFTAEQEQAMAAAYRDGASLAAIAADVGCSETTVRKALKAAGVQMRPAHRPKRRATPATPPHRDLDRLVEDFANLLSQAELALTTAQTSVELMRIVLDELREARS